MSALLTGGCLCGAIRYTIGAPVTALRACHCLNCQKASGTGGTVNAVVPSESFRITKGQTRRYDDSATESGRTLSRHFCANCGSPIYSHRNPNPGFVVLSWQGEERLAQVVSYPGRRRHLDPRDGHARGGEPRPLRGRDDLRGVGRRDHAPDLHGHAPDAGHGSEDGTHEALAHHVLTHQEPFALGHHGGLD